jgi:hypothetical protein
LGIDGVCVSACVFILAGAVDRQLVIASLSLVLALPAAKFVFADGNHYAAAVVLVLAVAPWRMLIAAPEMTKSPSPIFVQYALLSKSPGILLSAFYGVGTLSGWLATPTAAEPAIIQLLGVAFILPEWLLLLPFLRGERAQRVPEYAPWLYALLLLPCCIGFVQAGAVTYMCLPLALWLGRRFGMAAIGPIAIMLSPLLFRLNFGGVLGFIRPSMGLFVRCAAISPPWRLSLRARCETMAPRRCAPR